jgi:hypothetical protein
MNVPAKPNATPPQPSPPGAAPDPAINKLSFGARPMDAAGDLGGVIAAPRPKIGQQTMVLVVVLFVSAGAIFGMRTLGIRAGVAMGTEAVEYSAPELEKAATYQKIMADLTRVQNPLDVALGSFGKSPFMLQQEAAAVPVDPVAAGEDTPEQKAQHEAAAKIEERRQQLADELAAFKVQSILGGTRPLAWISGEIYRPGDTIGENFKVVSIEKRTVTLEADGHKFTLNLDVLDASTKTSPVKIGGKSKLTGGKPSKP